MFTLADVPSDHLCASPQDTGSGWIRSAGGTPRSPWGQQTPEIMKTTSVGSMGGGTPSIFKVR